MLAMSTTESYEKHTPNTDALDTLGSIITPAEGRDAIHLAVEPCMAVERLRPGQDVRLVAPQRAAGRSIKLDEDQIFHGIVDPFLKVAVEQGEWFWLVVYPRQVTSLRHVWEHPSFPPSDGSGGGLKSAAEEWLREYAQNSEWSSYDNEWDPFEKMVETFENGSASSGGSWPTSWRIDGEYLHVSGQDASGSVPHELYDNMEKYLGRVLPDRPEYFSCSC